ncbi:MAG: hypothetical protein ACRYFX_18700 [Janthinobacterium lividum]
MEKIPSPPGPSLVGPPAANSMSANWCSARTAEARAWRDSTSQSAPGWHHVNELLSQLDNPPTPAVGPGLLSAEALKAIRHSVEHWPEYDGDTPMAVFDRRDLLSHIDASASQVRDAQLWESTWRKFADQFKTEAAAATSRSEEAEAREAGLQTELAALKLVHQGYQTKLHAILRQVMHPLPDYDEAVRIGQKMVQAGWTAEAALLNCEEGCQACPAPSVGSVGAAAECEPTCDCLRPAFRETFDGQRLCAICDLPAPKGEAGIGELTRCQNEFGPCIVHCGRCRVYVPNAPAPTLVAQPSEPTYEEYERLAFSVGDMAVGPASWAGMTAQGRENLYAATEKFGGPPVRPGTTSLPTKRLPDPTTAPGYEPSHGAAALGWEPLAGEKGGQDNG